MNVLTGAILALVATAYAAGVPTLPLEGITPRCRRHMDTFLQSLSNYTRWAVRMADANAKLGSGVLSAPYQLGNFDECVEVSHSDIRGRYCLLQITVKSPRTVTPCHSTGTCSVWTDLQSPLDRLHRRRDVFRWGVCLPSGCSPQDVTVLATSTLRHLLPPGAQVEVEVPKDACHSTADPEDSSRRLKPPRLLVLALAVYALTLLGCSLYHWNDGKEENIDAKGSWHSELSLRTSWRRLTSSDYREDYLSSIDGLRVITIIIVVFGHRGDLVTMGPSYNADELEKLYDDVVDAFVMNGHLVVDAFFTLVGYLLATNSFQELQRKGRLNLLRIYGNRYVRMTPAYAVVLAVLLYLLYDLDSGPLWKEMIGKEVDYCRQNAWTNMLYISNYVGADRPCMETTWYISTDAQLYLIGPPLVLAIYRWGAAPGLVALVAAVFTSAAVTYFKELDAIFMPDTATLGNNLSSRTYLSAYVTTHCRAAPFLVGILFAYWLHRHRKQDQVLDDTATRVLRWYPLPVAAAVLVWGAGWVFYLPIGSSIHPIFAAAYAGLHRPIFALGIAFLVTSTKDSTVNQVLSQPIFQVPSRLTYCVYLTHFVVQKYQYASIRTPVFLSFTNVIWYSLADYIISLLVSLPLYLLVESPILLLVKHLLSPVAAGYHGKRNGKILNRQKDEVPRSKIQGDIFKRSSKNFNQNWMCDGLNVGFNGKMKLS